MTHDGKTAIIGLGRANHIAFVDVASREIQDYVLLAVVIAVGVALFLIAVLGYDPQRGLLKHKGPQ